MTSDEELENDVYDLAYKVIKKNRELQKRIKMLQDDLLNLQTDIMAQKVADGTFKLPETLPGAYPPYTIGPAINTFPPTKEDFID